MLLVSVPAMAQLSPSVARSIEKAQTLEQDAKLGEAIALLETLSVNRAFDKAFVDRTLGVFYWQYGNNDKAIVHIQRAVDSEQLQDAQAWQTKRMLADLLLIDGQYASALQYYYPLARTIPKEKTDQSEDVWLRIMQAHYQREQWQKVLAAYPDYERTMNNIESVSALSLKLGAQLQLEQWRGATPTLKALIALEPENKQWWRQLAANYVRLEKPKEALSTYLLAQRKGITLDPSERRTVAQLYANMRVPERAAKWLRRLPDNEQDAQTLAQQASLWQQAREWPQAISAWKLAAKKDSQYHWQLALMQIQQGEYQQALTSLEHADKGASDKDIALAKVRIHYKLKQYEKALKQARLAKQIEPDDAVESWLTFLKKRQQMQRS
ncbi:lipopolysaccharide assembly protein LapB [Salinivibrio sp. ES.052]|uniref:tetratricopeptide repeat protein n=1 Tax=Salinivibrio sp. ES.052 TaxID=1882823 RepID=UPI0015882039|nr:BTAD domain-containing putative transcriptional regulator [Salinivibrio sp. ES.052]